MKSFIKTFESTQSGIFGLCEDTLESLFLTILPVGNYQYKPLSECDVDDTKDPSNVLLLTIQEALINHAGFRIQKCDNLEICNAAEHIFEMIMYSNDPEFQRILHNLKSKNIIAIVDEAFNCLYNGPHPRNAKEEFGIYTDTCTVIFVIMQWLVMYMCKRLMQLVTPEALVIHNQEIPRYYSQFYMKFQEHFDFKRMVYQQLRKNER